MTARYWDQFLESNWRQKARSKGRVTLPVSIALHVVGVAALLILPLLIGVDELPEPEARAAVAFFVEAAPPPAPPPPPPAAAPKAAVVATTSKPRPRVAPRTPTFVAPMEVPEKVAIDPGAVTGSEFGLTAVDPAGVEGGVEGGVPGGVVGGVVGGVLGGVLEPRATPPPPTTPPAPPGPVRVGGRIKEPGKIHHVPPSYPEIAQLARIQGIVVLEAVIGVSGVVEDVRVVRGIALLNDAATAAVRQWRYTPTLLNGIPVPVIMTVTVHFRLSG